MNKKEIFEKIEEKIREVESIDCENAEYNWDTNSTNAQQYNTNYYAHAYTTKSFIFVSNSTDDYLLDKENFEKIEWTELTKKELLDLYIEIKKEVEERKKEEENTNKEIEEFFKNEEKIK